MVTYARVPCPKCGKLVAENWMVRHLKAEHPLPPPLVVRVGRGSVILWRYQQMTEAMRITAKDIQAAAAPREAEEE